MSIREKATIEPGSNSGGASALASILVIDGEEIACTTLSALLKDDGFYAVTAQSGKEGVELLRVRKFDVVIADLMMPGMECIQTIPALKEVDPDVEVIILTGSVTVESTIAALRQGACDFLQKPASMAQLRPALLALNKRRGELTRGEACSRAVIETAREVIVLLDREGVVRGFNPAAEQIFGLSREQAMGRNLADFAIPPRLLEVFHRHLDVAYRDGRDPAHGSVEVLALRQNGEEFPLEISIAGIETPQGKLLSTIGRDTTERKRVMEALRASEAKLRIIFDGVEAGIFLIDPMTHRIVDANSPAHELVGADRNAVIGTVCQKFVCPAYYGRCPVTVLGQEVDNSECVLLTVTGERRPIIKTGRAVVIGGRPILLESFVDITARKRAGVALREAEEHFRSLFASIPLPTFFFDAQTLQYLEVNDAAVSASGYSRDEVLKMRVVDLAPPESAHRVVSKIQTLPPHTLEHSEGRYRLKSGRLLDVKNDFRSLDFHGQKAVLAVTQDITDGKRVEADMAERHRLAVLVAEVGVALTRAESLRQGLQQCAEILVRIIGAAFARFWTVNEGENVLELQASAGMYTHIDGGHARVPIGKLKIGRIAKSGEPHLTNLVQEDPQVGDPEWARREGMVAFAGYPLSVEGRVLGVAAAFSRQPLTAATLQAFASVADNTAQFIRRKRAEEALRESEDRYRDLVENSSVLIGTHDPRGRILSLNRTAAHLLEASTAEELAGRRLSDFVPPELLTQFDEYLKTILREGHAEGLMVLTTPSGKRKIVGYRNTLRRQDPNEPIVR